jgi:hypothetical protein
VRNIKNALRVFIILFSLFIFLSCASLSPVDMAREKPISQATPETLIPQWRSFAATDALVYFAGKIARPRLELWALRIDLSDPNLRVVAAGGADNGAEGTFLSSKVSSFVRDRGLLAGINALPFDPVSGREGEPRTNIGVVISDGIMLSPPHSRFDALVFWEDGSAAIVPQSRLQSAENITTAVGGFRQILAANEIVPRVLDLTPRHPRSAAGISADSRFLYLLVIDGRRPGSVGATEAETALILRALGAYDGINFDGGGSSALVIRYPDGAVRAVNVPIHKNIPGRERAVAGCLGVELNNSQ